MGAFGFRSGLDLIGDIDGHADQMRGLAAGIIKGLFFGLSDDVAPQMLAPDDLLKFLGRAARKYFPVLLDE